MVVALVDRNVRSVPFEAVIALSFYVASQNFAVWSKAPTTRKALRQRVVAG